MSRNTLSPGTTLGPYEILAPLGAGGMGAVYRARDPRLERDIAIKVLPDGLASDPDFLRRFRDEALTASRLNHPNIIHVYDLGEQTKDDGPAIRYVAMELVEGQTLGTLLKDGPLPWQRLEPLARQVLEGLVKAHAAGIVHRDLKTENLMLTEDGFVKILDFGLAKRLELDEELSSQGTRVGAPTQPGMALGTLGYMAPEQAKGLPADHRADQFSFGVVLYEMATGERPFARETPAESFAALVNGEPEPLEQRSTDLPAAVCQLVMRCLAKTPVQRYPTTAALLEDFTASSSVPTAKTPASASEEEPSIAVLPFRDMSPAKDQAYFCEGMAEEILNALAGVQGLKVAARSSAFRYGGGQHDVREVGAALAVGSILEGSVRTAGNQLRVTAQLSNAADGYQIWSRRYDRKLDDVFAIQDEIAEDIGRALSVELGDAGAGRIARHTENREAYHHYLRGRHHWFSRTRKGFRKATSEFERAVELDPDYVLPHAGIAELHALLGFYSFLPESEAYGKARASAERALALDPDSADANRAMGLVQAHFDFDLEAALESTRGACTRDPTNPLNYIWSALYLADLGRFDESLEAAAKAQELDPLNLYVNSLAGGLYCLAGHNEAAIAEGRKALDLDPEYVIALWCSPWAYIRLGRYAEALELLERAARLTERAPFYLGWLGWAQATSGDEDSARATLAELEERTEGEYVAPLYRAFIHAALGEKNEAFELLDEALEKRNTLLIHRYFPVYDTLRSDPRYDDLWRRIVS